MKNNRKKLEEILRTEGALFEKKEELFLLVPELKAGEGFEQNSKYHNLTVLDHILKSVDCYKELYKGKEDPLCLIALLLHDIAKPLCYTEDMRGGHFYGHADKSCTMAMEILKRIGHFSEFELAKIMYLVRYHDVKIINEYDWICQWSKNFGDINFIRLIRIQKADTMAHSDYDKKEKLRQLNLLEKRLMETLCINDYSAI